MTQHEPATSRLRRWAKALKADVYTLYLAARDPRTPWYAKAVVALVTAYALSPIDLIPDFIPVLGYLDDVILIPAGVALAIRLIPPPVLCDCRATARARLAGGHRPRSSLGAIVIVVLWVLALVSVGWAGWRWWSGRG